MPSRLEQSHLPFEMLAIMAVSGLLLVTAIRIDLPLWSIPATILFALAGLTLLCMLPFANRPWRSEELRAAGELTTGALG
jgi:hypothetical protein